MIYFENSMAQMFGLKYRYSYELDIDDIDSLYQFVPATQTECGFWRVHPDVQEWLDNHCSGAYSLTERLMSQGYMQFENQNDAFAFKIRWG